jgi:predicted nucleotidyltransferase
MGEQKTNKLLEEIKSHREQIVKLAEKRGVKNIRIFGSVARGEADEKSDIDFLVDVEEWCSLMELGGLSMELEEMFHRHVDVAVEKGMKARVYKYVARDAIAL